MALVPDGADELAVAARFPSAAAAAAGGVSIALPLTLGLALAAPRPVRCVRKADGLCRVGRCMPVQAFYMKLPELSKILFSVVAEAFVVMGRGPETMRELSGAALSVMIARIVFRTNTWTSNLYLSVSPHTEAWQGVSFSWAIASWPFLSYWETCTKTMRENGFWRSHFTRKSATVAVSSIA